MNCCLRSMCAVLITVLFPLLTSAAELSTGEKDTILIGALKVQPSVIEMAERKNSQPELKRVINTLESQFISALNATRVFQLVERNRKADLELEQGFAAVAVDPNDKNAAQTGRMAGAKFAFLPQIDGFEDKSEIAEHQAIGRASLSRKLFLSAVVQIVDTTTGKLLPDSPSIQITKTEEIENARIGQLSGSDEVIVALAKEMAKKLSQEVVALLRPAKVLTVTGKLVMFNRGSEAGFTKGDLVEIYAVQNVKDEDTGELFRNEVPVGQAVITRIDKNQSYAAISGDDMGITKGCVVRFMKSAASRAAEGEPPPDVTQPEFGSKSDPGTTPGSSEKPLKWK
jgi:curli biogenesis system outer membrane secretion channel CsgG